ncbi:MAG TPA: glycosyltransferase family 4 protein [Verrucomicrobiae bacterium]|nr:glycosyltransferase family 4 protein [Verrucomicrobiae bacterium]
MRVIVTHPGTQHAFRLAAELSRLGLLEMFWTGFAYPADSRLGRFLRTSIPSAGIRRKLSSRALAGVPSAKLRCLASVELWALLWKSWLGGGEELYWRRNAAFQRGIPDAVLAGADAVVGFDTASWILAKRCGALGIPFILDQSIAHPLARERLHQTLAESYPDWSDTYQVRRADVLAGEREEHAQAKRIVVASTFTRRTLIEHGVGGAKIRVNPYGVDLERFRMGDRDAANRPLRFIFVGALQARKGLPLLLEAWRRLKSSDAELRLVGPAAPDVRKLIPGLPGLSVRGSVPNSELPRLFADCDVFVFPSLFEGFGLVILEAMASGLPAITTEATGGPDFISEGRDGFLVPAGDVDALEAKMRWCIENRGSLAEMGAAARTTAERFTWGAYGERWAEILEGAIDLTSAPQKYDSA